MASPDFQKQTEADMDDIGQGSPLHGFQGDPQVPVARQLGPDGLTIALSREAGSRAGTIARRVARATGWQAFNQELLDYICSDDASRDSVLSLPRPELTRWAEERLLWLQREKKLSRERADLDLVRVILALGARGEAVLVGRGAGSILPARSTLHVRIFAPLNDRIAYMSQWLRLTMEQAAEQVRLRDTRRAEFIRAHFRVEPSDVYQYDLLLNSSLLGEDQCVEIIVQAARAKLAALTDGPGPGG